MKIKFSFALIFVVAVLAGIFIGSYPRQPASISEPAPQADLQLSAPEPTPVQEPPSPQNSSVAKQPVSAPVQTNQFAVIAPAPSVSATDKLERLNQTREMFHALAAGDPTNALRAAKQITDDTERETALLTLVTEWTHGKLGPARFRALRIGQLGLEAGFGIELADQPDLALLWANELADGPGRRAVFQQVALNLLRSDPSSALALGDQLPEAERLPFLNTVFAGWGGIDTEAAFKWTDQISDPAAKEAALKAIRSSAPVGIGAALKQENGYTVINELIPGAPAELSGQLHPGDRIVALAQADGAFVDAHDVPLNKIVDMVRGAPNTLLQLQVLPADAPPNSAPRTVAILRDQIKFKR